MVLQFCCCFGLDEYENYQILKPFKNNPDSFNRKVTEYFANSYGLTQYLGS